MESTLLSDQLSKSFGYSFHSYAVVDDCLFALVHLWPSNNYPKWALNVYNFVKQSVCYQWDLILCINMGLFDGFPENYYNKFEEIWLSVRRGTLMLCSSKHTCLDFRSFRLDLNYQDQQCKVRRQTQHSNHRSCHRFGQISSNLYAQKQRETFSIFDLTEMKQHTITLPMGNDSTVSVPYFTAFVDNGSYVYIDDRCENVISVSLSSSYFSKRKTETKKLVRSTDLQLPSGSATQRMSYVFKDVVLVEEKSDSRWFCFHKRKMTLHEISDHMKEFPGRYAQDEGALYVLNYPKLHKIQINGIDWGFLEDEPKEPVNEPEALSIPSLESADLVVCGSCSQNVQQSQVFECRKCSLDQHSPEVLICGACTIKDHVSHISEVKRIEFVSPTAKEEAILKVEGDVDVDVEITDLNNTVNQVIAKIADRKREAKELIAKINAELTTERGLERQIAELKKINESIARGKEAIVKMANAGDKYCEFF